MSIRVGFYDLPIIYIKRVNKELKKINLPEMCDNWYKDMFNGLMITADEMSNFTENLNVGKYFLTKENFITQLKRECINSNQMNFFRLIEADFTEYNNQDYIILDGGIIDMES
jgi:hypothetical protein